MMEGQDRFGNTIRAALRDTTAECRLPDDFGQRLSCAVPSINACRAARFARWIKIAASVIAMASFASFAMWLGKTVLNRGDEERPVPGPTDPETEMLSNQRQDLLMVRQMSTLVGAAVVSVEVPSDELTSEPTFVFLKPETSSFWNTATNNTMTVPIDYPSGAHSATLTVGGLDYAIEYRDIASSNFTFELPVPTSPETENVYNLTLTFDNGVVRTAKLGLIQGLSPDSEGTTRCIAPDTSKVWGWTRDRAVLPIPYGTTSLKVNNIETDTGLCGAQGWFAIGGLGDSGGVTLSLVANGIQHAAAVVGRPNGLMLVVN